MPQGRWEQLTIANNAAVTGALDVAFGERIVAIETPSAWTAADIVVQVSRDGTNYIDLKDLAGTLLRAATSITTNAAELRSIANDLTALDLPLGATKIKLRSCNTASSADVNQGGARVLWVLLVKD